MLKNIILIILSFLLIINTGFAVESTLDELKSTETAASQNYQELKTSAESSSSYTELQDANDAYQDSQDRYNATNEKIGDLTRQRDQLDSDYQEQESEMGPNEKEDFQAERSELNEEINIANASLFAQDGIMQEKLEESKAAENLYNDLHGDDLATAKKAKEDAHTALCNKSGGCIDKTSFQISVPDFTPGGGSFIKSTTTETINYTLGTIIEKLMIGLGSLSLLIMTIGAGYMIIFHGQDELLSKGKYIFMSGVIALVVALSSYYIVSLLRYLLYS